MNKYSIVKQIAIINTLIMALFMSFFVIENYNIVSNQFDQLEREKIDGIAKNIGPVIAINLSLGMKQNYIESIRDVLEQNQEILGIELISKENTTIYKNDKKDLGESKTTSLNYALNDEVFKTQMGTMRVHYKISTLYKNLLDDFEIFLFIMLVFFLIALIISVLLINYNLKPLLRLKEKILNYTIDNNTELGQMYGNNEIALINNATAEMFQRIEEEVKTRIAYENQIMQKSRLASMGEMLDNIAHQWRQPLMKMNAILLNIDRAAELDKLDKEFLSKKLEDGSQTLHFMSQTIETFREFVNPSREKADFELVQAVENSIEFFKKSYANVEILLESKEKLHLFGVKNELSQVMLSILTNAKEILEEREIAEPKVWINLFHEEQFVCIRIEDNAGGAEKEILEKIFDPYFTTRYKSGGTGMGLYICKMIIKNSFEGDISAKNGVFGLQLLLKMKI